ncbi:MAG: VWA domain-containing protein [Asticcacaulis sp.]
MRNQMKSGNLVMPDPTTAYAGILQTSQTCPTAIQPLTNQRATVTSAINTLVYNVGSYYPETYIPGGLIWGVNIVSPPAPFTEGQAYDTNNKEPKKVIVLMTDGANTLYSNSSGNIATANATQLATTYTNQESICTYAKGKKIEIYVIGLGVTDATALQKLQSCATDSAHYFDAQNANDLISAFEIIGGKLSVVRLMQ